VSSGRRRGSLDHADPLISIATRATWSPWVISHSHPRAPLPGRASGPMPALISQLTGEDYGLILDTGIFSCTIVL
jgi:hypothetical protein